MATTNFDDVQTTIRTRFNAQFATAQPTYAIMQQNDVPREVDGDDKFVRLNIIPADSQLKGLGTLRLFRDYGLIKVQMYAPLGEGIGELMEVADDVRDIFMCLSASGVTYRTPYVTVVGESGSHFQVNVTVPYFSSFTAT